MNWVSRSIPNHWQNFPSIGKINWRNQRFVEKVRQFSVAGANWHDPCIVSDEPAQIVPAQRKQEGLIMKSTFAQLATFAFSAAGALAIIVGAIDQPAIAANVAGAPAIGLVGAASSPAVGPMA